MQIFWHGQSCFKIQGGDTAVIIDPYDKTIGLKVPRLQGNIVLTTHGHYDHNAVKAVGGNPFIVNGPGEYEKNDIFILGLSSWHDEVKGAERGPNTIYIITMEGMNIAHLGDLGHVLEGEQLAKLDNIDILLIPVGGVYTLDAKKAAQVVSQIEPRIVIPMHYKIPGLNIKLDSVENFIKEMGVSKPEKVDKFKIAKKDLPADKIEVVILNF